MCGRLLSIGTISRAAVAATIIATSRHFWDGDVGAAPPAVMPAASMRGDPLARELVRCRAIGMAANDHAACEAAWAENRRRFFNDRSPSDRAASAPAIDQPSAAKPEDR
jgi:conjugative transfer region protein TrbK